MDEVSHLRRREQELMIGVCTGDFSLLHDVLRILKERKIHHIILEGGQRWDSTMDVLAIHKGLEPPTFTLRSPPTMFITSDPVETVDRAIATAFGRFRPEELIVGIDPGKRPGLAFIADGILISTQRSTGPVDVTSRLRKARRAFDPKHVIARIGDGDPSRRDLIIHEVKKAGFQLEIVDETYTTKTKKFRDENAAVMIAHTMGEAI